MTLLHAVAMLWHKLKQIFKPATHGHFTLVMPGRHFLTILCFMLFGVGISRSQSPLGEAANNQTIAPINIGDQIPDDLWNMPLQVVNHPDGKETITLGEYKDKLIILDFWATWCVPCIRNFPKLHDLQNEFGDKIKVLAVTPEDTDKITKFFTTGVGKEHTYVHSVIADSVLSRYFPHMGVPHIVWINPNGKVLNTTRADEVNTTNVQAVLDDQKTNMLAKVDIDRNKPLFLSDNFGENMELRAYSIFAKGGYSGLPSAGKAKKSKEGKVYGWQFTNLPMMDIYHPIAFRIFESNHERFSFKRMSIEVQENELLTWILKDENSYENFNLYNYELIVPENEADSLYYYMLSDLNRYSHYTASIEKRMIDCLVLVRTSRVDKIKSKGGKIENTFPKSPSILTNRPLSAMLVRLNGNTPFKQPIIDETGYDGNVDIKISAIEDLESLRKELSRYDLDLIPAKRNLNMFVIKDK